MSWFNNKKEETKSKMPELPELPELPENQRANFEDDFETYKKPISVEVSPLPSLQSPRIDRFHQEQIKNAVRRDMPMNTIKRNIPTEDMQKSKFELPSLPIQEYETPKLGKSILTKSSGKIGEPVYIRVDKFEKAVGIINEIKSKIESIEKALEKTRRINEQEEAEISSWESEIQNIKLKLDSIDREILNDVE